MVFLTEDTLCFYQKTPEGIFLGSFVFRDVYAVIRIFCDILSDGSELTVVQIVIESFFF